MNESWFLGDNGCRRRPTPAASHAAAAAPQIDLSDSAEISNSLNKMCEAPFANQENWFDYFPLNIRPRDAIILAGSGATPTLHRDPFEWTGTSICLEGTKIWRFILPPSEGGVSVVDEAFRSYHLDSIAWEMTIGNNTTTTVVVVVTSR